MYDFNDFIAGWKIDPTVCDDLIAYYKKSNRQVEGTLLPINGGDRIVDHSLRYSYEVLLEGDNPQTDDPVVGRYYYELQTVLQKYIEKYPACNKYSSYSVRSFPKIQYYPLNGGVFGWHCERTSKDPQFSARHLVFMTYLNDVTDEGGTEFFHQGVTVKPEKGLTLIWPSDWTHVHRGIPSETQEKYIATGWLSYYE